LSIATFPQVGAVFRDTLLLLERIDCRQTWNQAQFQQAVLTAGLALARMLGAPLLVCLILAVAGAWGQFGVFLQTEPLFSGWKGLSPSLGLKRVLPTVENVGALVLTAVKVGLVAWLVYLALTADLVSLTALPLLPLADGLEWGQDKALRLALHISAALTTVAASDYLFRRHRHLRSLMMSKQEVKEEMRQTEGDPLIRSRLRQRLRQMLRQRLSVAVPKAQVVITNPVHVAVALRYEPGDWAPRVVGKGLRKRAQLIKRMARDNGVPVVEDPPLARALYKHTPVGGYIPSDLFAAVAVVLARLRRIEHATTATDN
jgi:flagellar biosynthetic protein FlhB